jgi:hypothetical protein
MSKIWDSIARMLCMTEEPTATAGTVSAAVKPDSFPPKVDDHAYYVRRIDARIVKAQEDDYYDRESKSLSNSERYEFWSHDRRSCETELRELTLSTLKMLDEYQHLKDVKTEWIRDESLLRSVLYASAYRGNEGHEHHSVSMALKVMTEYHGIPSDITGLKPKHADAVSAACNLLISTGLYEGCPPRLSAFVMQRPDVVQDVIEYVKQRKAYGTAAHDIDVEHLTEVLDSPSQSLREGTL